MIFRLPLRLLHRLVRMADKHPQEKQPHRQQDGAKNGANPRHVVLPCFPKAEHIGVVGQILHGDGFACVQLVALHRADGIIGDGDGFAVLGSEAQIYGVGFQAALAKCAVWRGVGDGRVLKGLFFLPCGQGEKARYAAQRKGCQRDAQQGDDVAPQHAARVGCGLQRVSGGWGHIVGGDGRGQYAGFYVDNQRNGQQGNHQPVCYV